MTDAKVRLGVIGLGNRARYLGGNFLQKGTVDIVAAADTNAETIEIFRKDKCEPLGAPTPAFHSDYREMLDERELDGVLIASPHTLHFQQAMDALDAGCHIFMEKPMVTDSHQARRLKARAEEVGRVISIAFPACFDPDFALARELIHTDGFGEVLMVNAFLTQNWLCYCVGKWRGDPALSGGGQAYDSGAHLLNGILWLTGLAPREVYAVMDNRGQRVDIVTSATIRLGEGATATVAISGEAPGMVEGILVNGSGGLLRCGMYGGAFEYWRDGEQVTDLEAAPTEDMYDNFVGCVRGGSTPPCGPEYGVRLSLLMDALYESARCGRPVRCD